MRIFRLIYKGVVLRKTKDDSFSSYQKLLNLKSNLKKKDPEYVKLKLKAEELKKELEFVNKEIQKIYEISLFETE